MQRGVSLCRQFSKAGNMPKSGGKTKSSTTSKGSLPIVPPCPVTETKDGHFSISIQVKPGSKVNAIMGMSEEAVSLQIAAPPVDGEANTAIIKYFAEILNLKKCHISLRGGKSRLKTITVESSSGLSVDKIMELLKNQK